MTIILVPGITSVVLSGGISVKVASAITGYSNGVVINPLSSKDQKINSAEPLFISISEPATLVASKYVTELVPGQSFLVPPKCDVWVNSQTSGHSFTAYFVLPYQIQYPPSVVPGQPGSGIGAGGIGAPFPPTQPTGLLATIPSYLYQEYSDDDDLQAWVAAYNTKQNDYVDTFNALNLPIYTGPIVADKLLDWVGEGLYGMKRPTVGVGQPVQAGPLNTWGPNGFTPFGAELTDVNGLEQLESGDIVITNDDLYRRILTWHFYKADGNYFSVRFLKRRIWRFIFGENGTAPESVPPDTGDWSIGDTEQISVTVGAKQDVNIRFVMGERTVTGGAIPNMFGLNGFGISQESGVAQYVDIQLNDLESTYVAFGPLPFMKEFKQCLDSAVIETPYQFKFTCTIN